LDVVAANSLLADHEIAALTSPPAAGLEQQLQPIQLGPLYANDMNTMPSHVVSPPTPISSKPYTERERAFSEPQIAAHRQNISPSPSPPPASTSTPNDELDDPLSHHWRQSAKRSSSLLRRLSRSGHRRSGSSPGDLRRTLSDPIPPEFKQEEEDTVFIPDQLQRGMEMLRVTRKKVTKRICWIDPISACVAWDSKNSSKRIPL
jgi:hypothetical protein